MVNVSASHTCGMASKKIEVKVEDGDQFEKRDPILKAPEVCRSSGSFIFTVKLRGSRTDLYRSHFL